MNAEHSQFCVSPCCGINLVVHVPLLSLVILVTAFVNDHACLVCLESGNELPPDEYLDWTVSQCSHVFRQPYAVRFTVHQGVRLPTFRVVG